VSARGLFVSLDGPGGTGKTTTAALVRDRLTARGLTETSPDPEDGRRLLVSLTRAGQQLAEKAVPNALAITKETLAPLDAREGETLVALLSKLR